MSKLNRLVTLLLLTVILVAVAANPSQKAAAEDAESSVLVSTDWLAENLENDAIRIIEVSVNPGVYESGHIPGAVNFVWHTDFVDPLVRDIVSQARLQELAQAAGINNDSTIILYGDTNNWFAAWGAWIFNVYGAADVRLLDGGRVKWEAEGRELSVDAETFEAGDFVAAEANGDLRAVLTEVLDVVEGETAGSLIDIRSAAEYEGRVFAPEGIQELSIRAGHIPGAVNVPWGQNVNEDGTFKSADELRALYADLGIDGSQLAVTYCRIGERAALTWFVLSQILGYDVALYDGSWTEYGNVVGLPIENPAGTVWGAQ